MYIKPRYLDVLSKDPNKKEEAKSAFIKILYDNGIAKVLIPEVDVSKKADLDSDMYHKKIIDLVRLGRYQAVVDEVDIESPNMLTLNVYYINRYAMRGFQLFFQKAKYSSNLKVIQEGVKKIHTALKDRFGKYIIIDKLNSPEFALLVRYYIHLKEENSNKSLTVDNVPDTIDIDKELTQPDKLMGFDLKKWENKTYVDLFSEGFLIRLHRYDFDYIASQLRLVKGNNEKIAIIRALVNAFDYFQRGEDNGWEGNLDRSLKWYIDNKLGADVSG